MWKTWTTKPKNSTNSKKDQHKEKPYVGTSQSNCWKPKTRRKFWKLPEKANILQCVYAEVGGSGTMKQTDFQLETMVARKWWKIFKELSLKSRTVNPEIHVLVWNLRSFLSVIWNWLPYMEEKERPKKEADQSRLAGCRFNKQGNLHKRFFVLGNPTKKQISAPASQNFKCLYRALMVSVTYSVQTISTPYSLKVASLKTLQYGKSRHDVHSKDREEIRAYNCLRPVYGSTSGHILSITSSNAASEIILPQQRWEKVLWFN